MEEVFHRAFVDIAERMDGPMAFRFVLQPLVAAAFAIRSGLRDAHDGKAPYLLRLVSSPGARTAIFAEAWTDVGKLFIVAMILDLIYQLVVRQTLYIGETIAVALILAILPYTFVRSLTQRVSTRRAAGQR